MKNRPLTQTERKVAEENEEIEVLGQESEAKAAKWVMEKQKEEDYKEDEAKAVEQTILEENKKRKFAYRRAILETATRMQASFDIPKGFRWGSQLQEINDREGGLMIWFKDPKGYKAAVAMKISHEPKFDLNWLERRINDTLDLMEKIAQNYETPMTKGGIILPN